MIGTDEQLSKVKDVESQPDRMTENPEEEITLQNCTIDRTSKLCGKAIRETPIREQAKVLVVGIERNGQRLLNPESTVEIQEDDMVWIVGVKKRMEKFLSGH